MSRMANRGKLAATYTYVDESGIPLHEVQRFTNDGGKKTFSQSTVDKDGIRTWGISGARRVPYNLPAVIQARQRGDVIVIVEGEKDADSLIALGMVATTNCGGSSWKWTQEFVESFRGGANVIVIADCDTPGRKAAALRAALLAEVCHDVRILDLAPGRTDGYDVSDWLAAGNRAADLREHMQNAPRVALTSDQVESPRTVYRIESAATVANQPPETIEYDVDQLLPSDDAPALVFGPPASLKSWIGLHLCDAVVRGEPFLGHYAVRRRDRALYVNLDAGEKTFRNRVRRASNADGFDFVSLSSRDFSVDTLRTLMGAYRGGFVLLDCLSAIYNPDRALDPALAMRAFVEALRTVFAEFDCGGVVIDHPHRPKERGDVGDYHGSVQKEAAFRTMWQIVAEPADDFGGPRRTKISCRKLSEGQPFAPVHVEVDFAGDRVLFSTTTHDNADSPNLLEQNILDWARVQVKAFTKTASEKAVAGRAADKRDAFVRLVANGALVATGAKRNGGDLYEMGTTSTMSGTGSDGVDSLGIEPPTRVRPLSGTGSDIVNVHRPDTQTTPSPPFRGTGSGTGSGAGSTGPFQQSDAT